MLAFRQVSIVSDTEDDCCNKALSLTILIFGKTSSISSVNLLLHAWYSEYPIAY